MAQEERNTRIHFSELTDSQVHDMWNACVDAAIKYADSINMSGLSEGTGTDRSHNVYDALHDAIYGEWEHAKQAKGVETSMPQGICDVCGTEDNLYGNPIFLGGKDRLCFECFLVWYDEGITHKATIKEMSLANREAKVKTNGQRDRTRSAAPH
jgi:hypothetical protein